MNGEALRVRRAEWQGVARRPVRREEPVDHPARTYSSYARGDDILLGTYNFLDLTPKGRDEGGLAYTMSWVRHHDRYGAQESFDRHSSGEPRETAS